MNNRVTFTPEGMARLAAIVRSARGDKSYTTFQFETGVSSSVLHKIEMWARPDSELKAEELKPSTLAKLSPHVGYTEEQLLAICRGKSEELQHCEPLLMAEDAWEVIMQLPPAEIHRLRLMLIERSPLSEAEIVQLLRSLVGLLER